MTGTLWQPRSGCGPGCLPSTGDIPAVPVPVRLLRLLRLFGVALAAALTLPLLAFAAPATRRRALSRYAGRALSALDVRLSVRGTVRQRRALVVANHISWLDILVLLAGAPDPATFRLVAKTEVRGWPVVGAFAAIVGTIFIDRSRPRSLPATVAAVQRALCAGDRVAVFPEGTTSCGRRAGAFRPAMFQAAVGAGAAVVSLRLRYQLPAGTATTAPAFIGDENLLRSLRRILALPGLRAEVTVRTAIHPETGDDRPGPGASRRLLAHLAAGAVAGTWPNPTPAPRETLPVAA